MHCVPPGRCGARIRSAWSAIDPQAAGRGPAACDVCSELSIPESQRQPYMKRFLEFVLQSRAAGLARPLLPHLPPSGRVLDLGSGTGHTVQALRRYTSLSFVEADVVNM